MKPVAHNKHEARKGTQAEITHAVVQQATAQARRQEMKWVVKKWKMVGVFL